MNFNAQEVKQHLDHVRTEQGDEAYSKARSDLARTLVLVEGGREFLRSGLGFTDPELNEIERIAREELAQKTPGVAMAEMLKAQLPHCQTQAQFNVFMAGFEALRACLDAVFAGNEPAAERARNLLMRVIAQATEVTRAAEQLRAMPEAMPTGDRAADLTGQPIEFHEHDQQRQLLAEISVIHNAQQFNDWYGRNQPRLKRIKDQALRNEVYDAIRRKRSEITEVKSN